MPIEFKCPHCGEAMDVDDKYAGTSGPCRACGQSITIPAMATDAPRATIPSGRKTGAPTWLIVLLALGAVGVVGLVILGLLAALLLPAVSAAREAARRSQCINNMKQISLALINYESVHGEFPPAYTVDENGQPLHSWRVLILPYLEDSYLYDQIDLAKPWDSPENKAILEQMPMLYRCPSQPMPDNTTSYLAVVGPDTLLRPGKGRKVDEVTDGLHQTLMVVEAADSGVHWAKPVDVDFDDLSTDSFHPGGSNIARADGSVSFMTNTISTEELRAMATVDGGEPVTY